MGWQRRRRWRRRRLLRREQKKLGGGEGVGVGVGGGEEDRSGWSLEEAKRRAPLVSECAGGRRWGRGGEAEEPSSLPGGEEDKGKGGREETEAAAGGKRMKMAGGGWIRLRSSEDALLLVLVTCSGVWREST